VNLSAFFGVVSTVDFALLGLWWVAVQARPDLRKHGSGASRMTYVVSLQFVVPGTASLLAQVDPTLTDVWRVSFAIAGMTGIMAILLLVPELAASGALAVTRFLRFGAVPLYALMTVIAVAPGLFSSASGKWSGLQAEAILFCLVIFLAVQVAWAAAMSTDPAVSDDHASPPSADAHAHADRDPRYVEPGLGRGVDYRAESPVHRTDSPVTRTDNPVHRAESPGAGLPQRPPTRQQPTHQPTRQPPSDRPAGPLPR
jgi:uncharacterized membrane protein YphA (DoxX/SURF4 family)